MALENCEELVQPWKWSNDDEEEEEEHKRNNSREKDRWGCCFLAYGKTVSKNEEEALNIYNNGEIRKKQKQKQSKMPVLNY